jgi:hypothetical protein
VSDDCRTCQTSVWLSRPDMGVSGRIAALVSDSTLERVFPGGAAAILWCMTVTDDDMETEPGSQYRWLIALAAFGILAAFVFSLTVVLVSVLSDQVLVSSKADLRRVEFGWPLVWVHQDQSSYDPSFPTHLSLASPWENPTSVSLGAVLTDVLFVFAVASAVVLLAAALMIALVRRRVGIRRTA